MASATAEEAVRNYLKSMKNPDSLLDQERINQLEAELAQEEDVLRRLELQEELRKAQSADAADYEDAFVTHAKEWAEANGVSAEAFISEGVDRAVLRRAGLVNGGRRRAGATRQRAARVSRDEIEKAITGYRKNQSFSIKTVQEKSGGSPATVRKVIADLLQSGAIQEVGPDPDHTGPGRAPTLYQRT